MRSSPASSEQPESGRRPSSIVGPNAVPSRMGSRDYDRGPRVNNGRGGGGCRGRRNDRVNSTVRRTAESRREEDTDAEGSWTEREERQAVRGPSEERNE